MRERQGNNTRKDSQKLVGRATIRTSPDLISMRTLRWNKFLPTATCMLLLALSAALPARAQTEEAFGDDATDPVRLFERGQAAHARGELEKALGFYEQALKVRPEFPEAQFQRGNALAALEKFDEAETALRAAIALKKNWSLPYSALGAVQMRRNRDAEAEQSFRQAVAIDKQDGLALRLLADIRLRAGDAKEALDLATRATAIPEAPASAWVALALAQKANGNTTAAKTTLNRVLEEEPQNIAALLERAELLTSEKQFDAALADLTAAAKVKPGDKAIASRLADTYQKAGKPEEALAVAKAAGLEVPKPANPDGVVGTPEEIEAANNSDPDVSRKALEKLLDKNPRNAMLLSRLGASYRTDSPARSLEYYRQAAEIKPDSAEYALGYAAALVQARRFDDAAGILRQVVRRDPQNYAAHANLATALYESKRYAEALPEYEWIVAAKPEITVAHYFIATAHDYLGEYPQALASYEKFLAEANAGTNQLEIDKVKLRLPSLRRQIQLGEGAKKKP